MITYQDYLSSDDKHKFLASAIDKYRMSSQFQKSLESSQYFRGSNTAVMQKTILRSRKRQYTDPSGRNHTTTGIKEVVGNRISSSFLFRFVTQQNQYLLSEGVVLDTDEAKTALGENFDHTLQQLGEMCLLHGVSYGFWNGNHLEALDSVVDSQSGFFTLPDEMTSAVGIGIQFWRLDPTKPRYIRLFTSAGAEIFRQEQSGVLTSVTGMEPYSCPNGTCPDGTCPNGAVPIIPLYANAEHASEFTPSIKSKIDAYDRILSDFADNLDRANDVYWVLNNFGGTVDEVAEMLEQINRVKAVVNISDGTGTSSTAEPHTLTVPYEARQTALKLLRKNLYDDYMALDMEELTGGSLTNVAIRVAVTNMEMKANRYEWQLEHFLRQVMDMAGVTSRRVFFPRQTIANESEIVTNVEKIRPDIDRRTALIKYPMIQDDEVETILARRKEEENHDPE